MASRFWFLILSSFFWSATSFSATLYLTEALPYSYMKNGAPQGLNVRIAEEITNRTGIAFAIIIVPSARHLSLFNQDPDAYSISLVENFNDKEAPQLAVVWQVPIAMLTKKDIVLKTYEDIIPHAADKGIGMMRRLTYPVVALDTKIKRVEINTVENGLRMLQAGRVVAIVASLPGIMSALEKQGKQEGQSQLSSPLIIGQTNFVLRCRPEVLNNSTSRRLAKTIDDMTQDGTIRRLTLTNQ